MLSGLLELYGERYERAKRERSGLDFEDLELVARDLLAGDAGLREAYAERFEHVLVDEFQDTNPLQNELLELLARQPVPRRRREPVDLPLPQRGRRRLPRALGRRGRGRPRREHHRQLPQPAARCSTRSTSPSAHLGPAFRAAAGRRGARAAPRVDPLRRAARGRQAAKRWDEAPGLGDPFGAALPRRPGGRRARLLAKRVDELTAAGRTGFGDVVMLFRATTAMGFFERALEERGIPVHVVGGRGYWAQQQVPTCVTGWRRSRTRSTSWPCTRCSRRRSRGSRSTRWR